MVKKIFVALFLAFFSCGLVACNTVQGFGEDLQSGGKSLSRAADKAKG